MFHPRLLKQSGGVAERDVASLQPINYMENMQWSPNWNLV